MWSTRPHAPLPRAAGLHALCLGCHTRPPAELILPKSPKPRTRPIPHRSDNLQETKATLKDAPRPHRVTSRPLQPHGVWAPPGRRIGRQQKGAQRPQMGPPDTGHGWAAHAAPPRQPCEPHPRAILSPQQLDTGGFPLLSSFLIFFF